MDINQHLNYLHTTVNTQQGEKEGVSPFYTLSTARCSFKPAEISSSRENSNGTYTAEK